MNAKTILEALHGTKCPTGATMTLSSFTKDEKEYVSTFTREPKSISGLKGVSSELIK
jgi:hypothetical protein